MLIHSKAFRIHPDRCREKNRPKVLMLDCKETIREVMLTLVLIVSHSRSTGDLSCTIKLLRLVKITVCKSILQIDLHLRFQGVACLKPSTYTVIKPVRIGTTELTKSYTTTMGPCMMSATSLPRTPRIIISRNGNCNKTSRSIKSD